MSRWFNVAGPCKANKHYMLSPTSRLPNLERLKVLSRPLVIFIDEIDSLQDEALISILRQLRDGYPSRPENFPLSVGLSR